MTALIYNHLESGQGPKSTWAGKNGAGPPFLCRLLYNGTKKEKQEK